MQSSLSISQKDRSITAVFWAVEEIPIPKDVNLPSITCNIESALEKLGHYAYERVEFMALGEKKEIASTDEWFEAHIYYVPEGDKDIRANLMIYYILNWASRDFLNKPRNLMVILTKLPGRGSEFARVLLSLVSRGFNVLLVLPQHDIASEELLRDADSIFKCTFKFDSSMYQKLQGPPIFTSKPYSSLNKPRTAVFWDIDDYPIPQDIEPNCIYQNLKSALEDKGYTNDMLIWAYVDKISFSGDLLDKYDKSKIYFLAGGDKNARHNRMMNDISLWVLDTHVDIAAPPNVIVISNNIEGDVKKDGIRPRIIDLIFTLYGLSARGYYAFLVQPNQLASELSQTSEWPGHLLDVGNVIGRKPFQKKKPKKPKTSEPTTCVDGPKTGDLVVIDNSPLLVEPIKRVDGAKTGVFWDIDDSPLPKDLDPQSIYQKFKSALEEREYYGEMTIWAYAGNMMFSNELVDEYRKANINFLHEGDKNARHNMMIHDILLWMWQTPLKYPTESNVIVISNNIPSDVDLIKSLKFSAGIGFCNLLVQPDAFPAPKKPETSEWPGYLLDGGKPVGRIRYLSAA